MTQPTISRIDLPLADGITAFSTLRNAEDPSIPFSGFNACHYVGDDPGHVKKCRRLLAGELAISEENLIIPTQIHSASVATITHLPVDPEDINGVDALVTNLSGVAIAINTADCVPIVMADPESGVIAAAHSGWRGTIAGIAERTIEAMTSLGADRNRIRVTIGPSICAKCFEVGQEVADQFIDLYGEQSHTVISENYPRPHVDLIRAITLSLTKAGVKPDHIVLSGICPRCNPNDYFSARSIGIKSGRTLTVVMR